MEKEIQESILRLQKIGNEIGMVQSTSIESEIDEEPFEYTERILFADIQEIKEMIRKRDKESLICTNRREIIDLNVCIYRKLKEALHQYTELQAIVETECKTKSKYKKSQNEEVSKHEEVLTVIFAQLKRLEEIASENHVTERFIDDENSHTLPTLTILPSSPLPYHDDQNEVQEELQEVEAELTDQQKASLQVYEKNKVEIDLLLDTMSEGLSEIHNQAIMIGDEISKQNQMLEELDLAVDLTTNTIQQDRETLQRNQKKSTTHHCGMYLCCIVLILFVIIIILNILRAAFSLLVYDNKHS